MSQQKILEHLGYVLGKEYVFTTKLDFDTLKGALTESSGKACGKGVDSGKVLVKMRGTWVTLTFFTLRAGAVMGPVFRGRLQKLSGDGYTLRGKFEFMWYEKLAFTLMRIGTTYRVLKIIILRPVATESWEYYIIPILMVISWAAPYFCWSLPQTRMDMMIGHLRNLGFCVS